MLAQRIVLSGDIDIYTAPTACRALDTIDGPAVIDLSEVRLLTAAGLTELARLAERVGYRVVALTGASPHVRRVLSLASFDRLFVVEDAGRPG
ncbi:MAG TPA: STAS domain-containing protein [Candidatus Acidoferrum sp.]|jgi:anti-anti-sigma factor|nr:STAS domain-containing protein [Candidatus Acidoferrum sp.]